MRKEKKKDDDEEIGTAPDGRIIVREKKKVDVDMLSSDEEDGIPENIRMSDQKVGYHMFSQKITTHNFRQQWRRQQKKILEDQRRVQSRERHVIKQEVIEQRKLEEMSRKLASMILIVIYHLEKICSTKGKAKLSIFHENKNFIT